MARDDKSGEAKREGHETVSGKGIGESCEGTVSGGGGEGEGGREGAGTWNVGSLRPGDATRREKEGSEEEEEKEVER